MAIGRRARPPSSPRSGARALRRRARLAEPAPRGDRNGAGVSQVVAAALRQELPALIAQQLAPEVSRQVAAEMARQRPRPRAPPSPDRTPSPQPAKRSRTTGAARVLFSSVDGVPIRDGRVDRSFVLSAPRAGPRRRKLSGGKRVEADDGDSDAGDSRHQRGPEPPKPKPWTGEQAAGESQRDFVARLSGFLNGLEEYLLWLRESYPKYDDNAQIAKYALHFLQDDAKITADNVYEQADEVARLSNSEPIVTWAMIKKALKDAAGPEATRYATMDELDDLKQNSEETVHSFTARFSSTFRKFMAMGPADAGMAAHYYVRGLREKLSSRLRDEINGTLGWFARNEIADSQPFRAIEVLSTKATVLEKGTLRSSQDQDRPRTEHQRNSGRAERLHDIGRRRQDGSSRFIESGAARHLVAGRPGRPNRSSRELPQELISERAGARVCFKCALPGHHSASCPNPINRRAGLPRANAVTVAQQEEEEENSECQHDQQGKVHAQ